MVPYPRLARFNYLQIPTNPLVCILRRNQGGGGVVKQPTLNSYSWKLRTDVREGRLLLHKSVKFWVIFRNRVGPAEWFLGAIKETKFTSLTFAFTNSVHFVNHFVVWHRQGRQGLSLQDPTCGETVKFHTPLQISRWSASDTSVRTGCH
jgi:hypothetical protein